MRADDVTNTLDLELKDSPLDHVAVASTPFLAAKTLVPGPHNAAAYDDALAKKGGCTVVF